MLTGFKTLIVSLALVVFGALETFDFTQVLNDDTAGIVTTAIGLVMAGLRFITKTPVGQKD